MKKTAYDQSDMHKSHSALIEEDLSSSINAQDEWQVSPFLENNFNVFDGTPHLPDRERTMKLYLRDRKAVTVPRRGTKLNILNPSSWNVNPNPDFLVSENLVAYQQDEIPYKMELNNASAKHLNLMMVFNL
jgi:hypothetical protein